MMRLNAGDPRRIHNFQKWRWAMICTVTLFLLMFIAISSHIAR
jgi:hypothetical protein